MVVGSLEFLSILIGEVKPAASTAGDWNREKAPKKLYKQGLFAIIIPGNRQSVNQTGKVIHR